MPGDTVVLPIVKLPEEMPEYIRAPLQAIVDDADKVGLTKWLKSFPNKGPHFWQSLPAHGSHELIRMIEAQPEFGEDEDKKIAMFFENLQQEQSQNSKLDTDS